MSLSFFAHQRIAGPVPVSVSVSVSVSVPVPGQKSSFHKPRIPWLPVRIRYRSLQLPNLTGGGIEEDGATLLASVAVATQSTTVHCLLLLAPSSLSIIF